MAKYLDSDGVRYLWEKITNNFSKSSHTHYSISTEGDNRSVATTPNDYSNNFVYKGLKSNSAIGSPSEDTYSYLLGLRGWKDSTGGNSHELAFNDSGIFRRRGATTEWGKWYKLLDSGNYNTYAATKDHTHSFASITSKPTTLSGYGITDGVTTSTLNSSLSKYLKLSGGTMTGILYADSAIIARGRGSNKGYQGYFNNTNYALIGNGTHIFNGSGKAQGDNALSFGQSSWAGVRNQDSDKDTYPYLAWQWMNTQPIEVNTTTSSLGGGTFYGYPLLGGEVVEYSTPDGGLFTYENTTQKLQFLLLVKNYDKFVFAGSVTSSEPRNVVCYMFGGMYVLKSSMTKVTERVIGDTTYYEVVIHQGSRTALDYTKYNPSNQMQLLCATKCNDSNFSGANSYISGSSSIAMNYECRAFGDKSIALGMQSIATSFCSNAIGYNSVAASYYSAAFGANSYALGRYSLAFGNDAVAKANMSAAFGQQSVTLGGYSMAFGARSVTKGNNSMAFGYESQTSGWYSMAFGYGSQAKNSYSTVFAFLGISFQDYQTIFGKYNAEETGALLIGGGTSDTNRKNIFKVDWSGNVTGKSFSGYSNSVGGEGFKIYPENSNEINFGGTGSSPIIVFGASSKDSRAVPTTYKFGADGKATLLGSADMLDGYHESDFFRINIGTIGDTTTPISAPPTQNELTDITGNGSYKVVHSGSSGHLINFNLGSSSAQRAQFYMAYNNNLWFRTSTNNDLTKPWNKIAFTSSNVASADKLLNPRKLTIGNTGKTFDGTADVSWSLDEIGVKDENVKYTTSVDNVDYRLTAIGQRIAGNVEGVNGVVTAEGITMNPSTGTLKATTFTGSLKGNADSATKLGTTTVGGSGTPIYLNNGVPTACNITADDIISTVSGYEEKPLGNTLNMMQTSIDDNGKSINSILGALDNKASTAVATSSANGLMSSEMYNTEKVSSISVRQGAAASEEIVRNHDIYVTYNKDKALNSDTHTVGGDVQLKIPNATTDYDGSMSYLDKKKLDSFNVDTSTDYYMGNVVRIDASYLLPPDITLANIKDHTPLYGIITDHLELMNGISSNKIPEMIRLTIHNFTYMFSLNTIDYTNNQIVYVCPYVQMQFTIDSSTSQFVIERVNPI